MTTEMHEIHVTVVSAEEAEYGTAEFWSGGRLIGFTHFEGSWRDGESD